jgi:hypothetical protein
MMTAAAAFIQIDDGHWSAVVAVLIAAAVAFAARRPAWLRLAGSAEVVVAGWMAVMVAGTSANGVVGWMMVTGITLTGVAFLTPRLTMLDSAGLTATALACLSTAAVGVDPAFVSLAFLVAGAHGFAYGVVRRRMALANGSAAVGAAALISLWFTSGTNAALLSGLAPFDFRGADMAVFGQGAALLLLGIGLRRWQRVTTWLAYGPGLALVLTWTATVQITRSADWATMAGLVIGVTAIAIGGWRRMAAPLVMGSASLMTTVVIASTSQLASLPGWSWLVVGGMALLGMAALIERRNNGNGNGDTNGDVKAMLDRFR